MKEADARSSMSAGVSNGSKSVSCMIDTEETTNSPLVFCFVFFALVVTTKGLEDLETTKGDGLLSSELPKNLFSSDDC